MAWIELHQTLPQNKKTLRLKWLLHIKTPQAVGHLCMLWLWALDNAPGGDLTQFTPEEIAEVSGYDKKPGDFIEALHTAGFVDEMNCLHDWYEYAGKLIEKRKSDAERKRIVRGQAQNNKGQSSGRPADVQDTTAKSSADGAGNRTLPYLTVPNTYSDGGDDAQACAKTDQINNEDTDDSTLESTSQHKATVQEIDSLPVDLKFRFLSLCNELFTTYFGREYTEFDMTILFRLIRRIKQKPGQPIPSLAIGPDETELMANAFEAAAKANAKNLSYVAGVIRRFRERGIQSADEFWSYEVKRDLDKDKKLAGRTG